MSTSPVKVWRRQTELANTLGKTGKVITWTDIASAGEAFAEFAPFSVVLVEMEDGKRVFGQYVGEFESLKFGLKVRAILRRTRSSNHKDVIVYGIKFEQII